MPRGNNDGSSGIAAATAAWLQQRRATDAAAYDCGGSNSDSWGRVVMPRQRRKQRQQQWHGPTVPVCCAAYVDDGCAVLAAIAKTSHDGPSTAPTAPTAPAAAHSDDAVWRQWLRAATTAKAARMRRPAAEWEAAPHKGDDAAMAARRQAAARRYSETASMAAANVPCRERRC